MEVEKYMIHVGDVLEDPDMCFAHLLEGKRKKRNLAGAYKIVSEILEKDGGTKRTGQYF